MERRSVERDREKSGYWEKRVLLSVLKVVYLVFLPLVLLLLLFLVHFCSHFILLPFEKKINIKIEREMGRKKEWKRGGNCFGRQWFTWPGRESFICCSWHSFTHSSVNLRFWKDWKVQCLDSKEMKNTTSISTFVLHLLSSLSQSSRNVFHNSNSFAPCLLLDSSLFCTNIGKFEGFIKDWMRVGKRWRKGG